MCDRSLRGIRGHDVRHLLAAGGATTSQKKSPVPGGFSGSLLGHSMSNVVHVNWTEERPLCCVQFSVGASFLCATFERCVARSVAIWRTYGVLAVVERTKDG